MRTSRLSGSWLAAAPPTIGAGAVLIGLIVLASWEFGWPGLRVVHPVLGGMGAHAAFCFVFAGASLWLLARRRGRTWLVRLGQAAAGIVVLFSLLTLAHLASGWATGLASQFPDVAATFPGPMPVASALVFLCLGLALVLLDTDRRPASPAEWLAFAAALIALLALIAYAYNAVWTFDPARPQPLAFHSVLTMGALAFGVFAARPRRGVMRLATSATVTGVMVRRLLPAAVGFPVLFGVVVLVAQRVNLVGESLGLAYYALTIVVVFGVLILRTAVRVDRTESLRGQAEQDLRTLNARLEQHVADRTAALEAANRELEAFSYSVSHDLRAPLRHVTGFATLLSERAEPTLDDQSRKYIKTITGAAARMAHLIDDLLTFSRMGRSALDRQPVNLGTVANEAVQEVVAHAHADGRSIEWTIGDLPTVDGDRAMMRLVFVNLLSNALKYTAPRAVARIEVGTVPARDEVVVFVRDNGVGFDMRYADKLFGVFQRLHRDNEFEGTGIGLANVQRIVTRHGGRVWAESELDRGATFFFALPAPKEMG